jgi:methionyl-tRNA formyltransferase
MKVVFFGSGDIGLPSLQWLMDDPRVELCAVITQPDRPAGRGLVLKACAVKELALAHQVLTLQPPKVRADDSLEMIAALEADLFVVMAYGQILSQELLDLPRLGALNLHASLLPRHRGAAPVQAAILAGETQSGITVMWMNAGLDTGDLLLAETCEIAPDETAGSLHDKLAYLAPQALAAALTLIDQGGAPRIPQDGSMSTYAPKLDRRSGRVDWHSSAVEIERKIRALFPWPGSSTTLVLESGKTIDVKIHRAAISDESVVPEALRFACGGGGVLQLTEIQVAGGRKMSAEEFCRGHKIRGVC